MDFPTVSLELIISGAAALAAAATFLYTAKQARDNARAVALNNIMQLYERYEALSERLLRADTESERKALLWKFANLIENMATFSNHRLTTGPSKIATDGLIIDALAAAEYTGALRKIMATAHHDANLFAEMKRFSRRNETAIKRRLEMIKRANAVTAETEVSD